MTTWQEHVNAYRTANPDATFKTALKEAAKTYTKKAKPQKPAGEVSAWRKHVMSTQEANKEMSLKEALILASASYGKAKA